MNWDVKSVIMTTSNSVEGRQIKEYIGVVQSADLILFPGGTKMIQNAWDNGVHNAVMVMRKQAEDMKADAVISMDFAVYNGYICATGTAVKLD